MVEKNGSCDICLLLSPRENLPWVLDSTIYTQWEYDLIFNNETERAFSDALWNEQQRDREKLVEKVDVATRKLSAREARSWRSDFQFMTALMSEDQLEIYSPYFIKLTEIMPRKMLQNRRRSVGRYLLTKHPEPNTLQRQRMRRFIRSSPLLYPASLIFERSNWFIKVSMYNKDQSPSSVRERLKKYIRQLNQLADEDICKLFIHEPVYLQTLERLKLQCRHFKISAADIIRTTEVN